MCGVGLGRAGLGGGVTTGKDCVLSRDNLFASVQPFYVRTYHHQPTGESV